MATPRDPQQQPTPRQRSGASNRRRDVPPSSRERRSDARTTRASRSERADRPERTSRSERATATSRRTSEQPTTRPRTRTTTTTRTRSSEPSDTRASAAASVLSLPFMTKRNILLAAGILVGVIVVVAVAMSLGTSSSNGNDAGSQDAAGSAPAFHRNEGPYSISFATTGDIMFGREVSKFIDANGGSSAMANVAQPLAEADVTIANLECPLTNDESEALEGKDVLWRSNPKGIESLKDSDITVMSLANNHIMDYGAPGLKDTLTALDGAGIQHAGAGMTEEQAATPVELNVNGVSIAFFSWTDIIPDYFLAYGNEPGVVSARMNMDDACKRVREAKDTHDLVIVAMHWGIEYQDYIDEIQQLEPAHKLVDAGADVIWGNHPHVIEGIEFYNNALISYSQGDFVCDHYSEKTGESFILNFDITQDGIQNVRATPVYLDDDHGIPSIVTGEHAQSILQRLEQISDGMNSSFEVRNDVAYITPSGNASGSTGSSDTTEATTSTATDSTDSAESSESASTESD